MNKAVPVGLGLLMLATALAPTAFAATQGTGTLFMYTDSTCSTLLPQQGGNNAYVLPATGTVIGIKVTGITEFSDGPITLLLQFTGEPNEFLAGTLTGGSTNCIAWTVGDFQGLQTTPSGCNTGIVSYGPGGSTKVSEFLMTDSNGGADGGHFLWGTSCGGTTTTTSTTTTGGCTENCPPPVPEFPVGLAPLLLLAIPFLFLFRKRIVSAPIRAFRKQDVF